MRRFLLDTNILVFLISGSTGEISRNVSDVLLDYENEIYTSSICVAELLHLYRIKKIGAKNYKSISEMQKAIENDFYIKILPFSKEHINVLTELEITINHKDPFDHMIISHAITEKLCLVSSDKMFENYTSQNLNFLYNKR